MKAPSQPSSALVGGDLTQLQPLPASEASEDGEAADDDATLVDEATLAGDEASENIGGGAVVLTGDALWRRPPSPATFSGLRLLVLSGTRLVRNDLANVLGASRRLQWLDASKCDLDAVPGQEAWATMQDLQVLYLHDNRLQRWTDIVDTLSAASLVWLTVLANPITEHIEPLVYRRLAIKHKLDLLMIDQWIVTDDERLGIVSAERAQTSLTLIHKLLGAAESPQRFLAFSKKAKMPILHLLKLRATSGDLVDKMEQTMRGLRQQSAACSASNYIQRMWKGSRLRCAAALAMEARLKSVIRIQKTVRSFLWRQDIRRYMKSYLTETHSLDLMLSADEMLGLAAAQKIQKLWKQFRVERKKKEVAKNAGIVITRLTRGYLQRRRNMADQWHLRTHRRIYFPEFFSWEFLVLLNVVREKRRMTPLPREQRFEAADILGIRLPDMDEVEVSKIPLIAVYQHSQSCILRQKRSGRFPDKLWDGPFHGLVGAHAPPLLRRWGTNSCTSWKRVFLSSCAPGPHHPIDIREESEDPTESYVLKTLLEKPENAWPKEARRPGDVLNLFMRSARSVGARMSRSRAPPEPPPVDGTPCYRQRCWNSERLLCYTCTDSRECLDLTLLLHSFSRRTSAFEGPSIIPLVAPVPFIGEYYAKRVCAATTIQATYKAHRARCQLSVSIEAAVTLRRAALCIQRGWRWGLVKRRMKLLSGAVRAVKAVRSDTLYIEERTLLALNVINSIARYPPLTSERDLSLGWSDAEGGPVLVMPERDLTGFMRPGGLPAWVLEEGEHVRCVGPEHRLKQVHGAQGLLVEGLAISAVNSTVPDEEHIVSVSPSLVAHEAALACQRGDASPALRVSGGTFRFVELKFRSKVQARQRALAFYLSTYNSKHNVAIPLVTKARLTDPDIAWGVLRVWDLYGLTWPKERKHISSWHWRSRSANQISCIPFCGGQSWTVIKAIMEWSRPSAADDKLVDATGGGVALSKIMERLRKTIMDNACRPTRDKVPLLRPVTAGYNFAKTRRNASEIAETTGSSFKALNEVVIDWLQVLEGEPPSIDVNPDGGGRGQRIGRQALARELAGEFALVDPGADALPLVAGKAAPIGTDRKWQLSRGTINDEKKQIKELLQGARGAEVARVKNARDSVVSSKKRSVEMSMELSRQYKDLPDYDEDLFNTSMELSRQYKDLADYDEHFFNTSSASPHLSPSDKDFAEAEDITATSSASTVRMPVKKHNSGYLLLHPEGPFKRWEEYVGEDLEDATHFEEVERRNTNGTDEGDEQEAGVKLKRTPREDPTLLSQIHRAHEHAELRLAKDMRMYKKLEEVDMAIELDQRRLDAVAHRQHMEHLKRRREVQAARAQKAQRVAARKEAAGLVQVLRPLCLEKAKRDREAQRMEQLDTTRAELEERKEEWQHRSNMLVWRRMHCLQQRRVQVDQLKRDIVAWEDEQHRTTNAEIAERQTRTFPKNPLSPRFAVTTLGGASKTTHDEIEWIKVTPASFKLDIEADFDSLEQPPLLPRAPLPQPGAVPLSARKPARLPGLPALNGACGPVALPPEYIKAPQSARERGPPGATLAAAKPWLERLGRGRRRASSPPLQHLEFMPLPLLPLSAR